MLLSLHIGYGHIVIPKIHGIKAPCNTDGLAHLILPKVIVVSDSGKLGHSALAHLCPLDAVDRARRGARKWARRGRRTRSEAPW